MGRFQQRIDELEAENEFLRKQLEQARIIDEAGLSYHPGNCIGPDVPAFRQSIRETVEATVLRLFPQLNGWPCDPDYWPTLITMSTEQDQPGPERQAAVEADR